MFALLLCALMAIFAVTILAVLADCTLRWWSAYKLLNQYGVSKSWCEPSLQATSRPTRARHICAAQSCVKSSQRFRSIAAA